MTTLEHLDTRTAILVSGAEPIRHRSVQIVPSHVEIITTPPGGASRWPTWLAVSGRILRITDGGLSDRTGRVVYTDTPRVEWVASVADAPAWVRELWTVYAGPIS